MFNNSRSSRFQSPRNSSRAALGGATGAVGGGWVGVGLLAWAAIGLASNRPSPTQRPKLGIRLREAFEFPVLFQPLVELEVAIEIRACFVRCPFQRGEFVLVDRDSDGIRRHRQS